MLLQMYQVSSIFDSVSDVRVCIVAHICLCVCVGVFVQVRVSVCVCQVPVSKFLCL